jgi:hypothetical protein
MKLQQKLTLVGAIALTIPFLAAFPLSATVEQHPHPVPLESINPRLAFSWSEIWDRLRRKEVPGGSRGNASQPTVCAVIPGRLVDQDTNEGSSLQVWGLDPVFLWQGEWSHLEVLRWRDHAVLLSQPLDPETRHLIYSDVENAIPLEPGGSYYWKLSREGSDVQEAAFGETSFRTLDEADRQVLEAELAEMDASDQALSQRVGLFAEEGLWADVVRELYTVDDLPPDLEALKAAISSHDFCTQAHEVALAHQ